MLNRSQVNQILEYYRQCLSRDEISKRVGVSTGSVSNTIRKWKTTVGDPDIDEIRQFMKSIRTTGMTLKQCSEGYRIYKLMKKLGIGED